MSTLSDRLTEALARHPGLRQADLRRLTNASSPSVTNWMGGRTQTLDLVNAHKLAAFFGCDPLWLGAGIGAPQWRDDDNLRRTPATPEQAPSLPQALHTVLDALQALPTIRWVSVRAQLDQLAAHPEARDDVAGELLALLQAPPGKRPNAA